MRTRYICLALAIVLICPFASGQWEPVQAPDSTGGYEDGYVLAVSGTNLFAGSGTRGVFRSTDNGTSWTAVNTGLPWHMFGGHYGAVSCLAVSDTNHFAGGSDGVFLSSTNGTSWKAFSAGLPYDVGGDSIRYYPVSCLAVSRVNLFAGTESDGIFLRANNATSWTAVNEGLQRASYDTTKYPGVSSLVISGTNLFAGTGNGVYKSTNEGTTWTAANVGIPNDIYDTTRYMSVMCLAISGTNLFAGASWGSDWNSGGVYLSTNNGTSWTYVSPAFPYTRVNALAVRGTNLFVGTGIGRKGTQAIGGPGVFLSTNNGTSWTAVNGGLPRFSSDDTAHYPGIGKSLVASDTYLFATTEYPRGIFRRPLSEMITSTQSSSNQLPVACTLGQNYPNPFNPSTTIKYELPTSSVVRLTVYDMLGREVSVLVDEMKNAGSYEVEFDAAGLSSGVYVYRIQAGEFVQAKKFVVLK